MQAALKGTCDRAKIDGFHFHDFRYATITNMCRAGIDHLRILKIAGYKTLEVFKQYNGFLKGKLPEAACRFNPYLTRASSAILTDSPQLLKICVRP
ncbi:MAG: hypothetical protein WD032_01715 [Nitrospirales bacterium]